MEKVTVNGWNKYEVEYPEFIKMVFSSNLANSGSESACTATFAGVTFSFGQWGVLLSKFKDISLR